MTEFTFENISDAVFHHAAERPQAAALIYGQETLSYGALAILVGQATVYLDEQGIKARDRVGVAMTNSIDHIILSLALMRIGAVLIEVPSETEQAAVTGYVTRFDMEALFFEAAGLLTATPKGRAIGLGWRAEISRLSGDKRYDGDPDELRLMVLSSGSTGVPKGIVATHKQRIWRSAIHASSAPFWTQNGPGMLLLAAPPDTGLVSQFLTNQLLLGGTSVLLPTFRDFIDLVRALAAWDDGICPVPPGFAKNFIDFSDRAAGLLFPKMRALVCSGQALANQDKPALIELVTPNLYEFYGSAGFGVIAWIGLKNGAGSQTSVGRPISGPGIEIQIVGPDGKAVAPGALGQLRLRGPTVSVGFFNPEDNARGTERFEGGWYYPGDVALMNKAGQLFLKGRMADVIKIGNLTIYPREIEEVVAKHEDVAEAAVIGRPGTDGVEEMVAFVVGRPGYRHREIMAHCHRSLPPNKRPKFIFYLDAIPKTRNGKINRPALRAAKMRVMEAL
jgi:acyl-CoA synthetase (AMP-forming)/AMP-acid ligase II